MGFLFTLSKVLIPMALVINIGLWVTLTALITHHIDWNNKDSMRELVYSLEANQLAEHQRDQLISNAVGMEVLHLLVHVLPFFGIMIGIWCHHFYTIHTMASFSLISLVYDDFDVVNRWTELWHSGDRMAQNCIYILSHIFHIFCVFGSLLFAFFVGKNERKN